MVAHQAVGMHLPSGLLARLGQRLYEVLFRYTLFWEKIILIIGEAAGGRYQDNRGGLGP
jgi:hypothetical protein